MRVKLHENGWTPIVEDWDLKTATDNDIKKLIRLLYSNTIVVLLNQNLTPDDQLEFCYRCGQTQSYEGAPKSCLGEKYYDIVRVTGNSKNPGAFKEPHELEWHLNKAANINKKNVVWLYGVEGTAGSRTSWINTILAYQDLHPVIQKDIGTAGIRLLVAGESFEEQMNGNIHSKELTFDQLLESGDGTVVSDQIMPLVHRNVLGIKGLYWPSRMIYSIEELPESDKAAWSESRSKEMIEVLHNHVFQEKYMYHHDWNDGDLVMSEQFLGIHKRWPFPGIEHRLLHRIEFDTSKIKF